MKVRYKAALCCIEGGGLISGCGCANPIHEYVYRETDHPLPGDEVVEPATPAPSDQDASQAQGIRINGKPATAEDVAAIGRAMDAEDGGYPAPGATAQDGAEPFGYWIEQKGAEPALLRKPAYIPEPSNLRTVTPLYATPTPTIPAGMVAHDGNGQPSDWDGGRVMTRGGPVYLHDNKPRGRWAHGYLGRHDLDIIAYTPLAAAPTPQAPMGQEVERTLTSVTAEARRNLRLTQGCLECNADDEQRWMDTITWLESLA